MLKMRFKYTLKQERGAGYIGAIIVMITLSLASFSLVNIHGTDVQIGDDFKQTQNALTVGNAGIVYARNKLYNGENPVVTNKAFGEGQFTIQTDTSQSVVTVTGEVGNAQKSQSLNVDFAKNCTSQTDEAAYRDIKLYNIGGSNHHYKDMWIMWDRVNCNKQAWIEKLNITWNQSVAAQNITCEGINGSQSCRATQQNITDLAGAAISYGSAQLTQVELENDNLGTVFVFNGTAEHDEDVVLSTAALIDNNDKYKVQLTFNSSFPVKTWFWVTFKFTDGSYLQDGPFQVLYID